MGATDSGLDDTNIVIATSLHDERVSVRYSQPTCLRLLRGISVQRYLLGQKFRQHFPEPPQCTPAPSVRRQVILTQTGLQLPVAENNHKKEQEQRI